MKLTSPTYTPKIHYMWSNSHWKQTGDCQEDLYNWGCKKAQHGIRYKEKRSDQVGTFIHGRWHRKGGVLHSLWDPLWLVSSANHILGTPALRSDTGKMSPLSWFEKQWDWQQGCKKRRLHSWKAHTCVLTYELRQRKWIETARDSGRIPKTDPACAPAHTSCPLQTLLLHSVAPH